MGDKFDIHDGRGLTADEIKLLIAQLEATFAAKLAETLSQAKDHADRRDEHMKGNIMQHVTNTGALTTMRMDHMEETADQRHTDNLRMLEGAIETSADNGKKIDAMNKYIWMGIGGLAVLNVALRYVHI